MLHPRPPLAEPAKAIKFPHSLELILTVGLAILILRSCLAQGTSLFLSRRLIGSQPSSPLCRMVKRKVAALEKVDADLYAQNYPMLSFHPPGARGKMADHRW